MSMCVSPEYVSIALVMQIMLYMKYIMMHHLFLMCIVVQFHMEILWNNSGFSHEVINLFVYQDIVIFMSITRNECITSLEMFL